MCGRFSQHWEVSEWNELWPAEWRSQDFVPRYNVSPGTAMLAVAHNLDNRAVGGLVYWGIKTHHTFLINARAETVDQKATFRPLLAQGRLVIPMNGYYEWHHETRQPHYIYTAKPLWALGLHRSGDDGGAVILTRPAVPELAAIHSRMPLLASSRDEAQEWLWRDGDQHLALLERLLASEPPMKAHAVSKRVNKSSNEGSDLIVPLF